MGYFPQTIAAIMRQDVVHCGILAHFDFKDNPMRVWAGFGNLTAGGHIWSGLGEFGSVSGIESAIGGTAPQVSFTLSGVKPELVAHTLNASDEVQGRDVTLFLQFFTDQNQVLDHPYSVWMGIMDIIKIQRNDFETRIIELTAETLFSRRYMPPFGYLTSHDQQRLFPGDKGLDNMPAMANKTVIWPQF